MNVTGIIIGIACIGGVYYFYKRGHKIRLTASKLFSKKVDDLPFENIDGELRMDDVVAWFKDMPLNRETDIPFVANAKAAEFQKLLNIEFEAGKEAIFMGVYNQETEEVRDAKVIQAKSLDEKLKGLLGKEPLVILN